MSSDEQNLSVTVAGITNSVALLKQEYAANNREIVSINHVLDKRESIRLEDMFTEVKIETIQPTLIASRTGLANRNKYIQDHLAQIDTLLKTLLKP